MSNDSTESNEPAQPAPGPPPAAAAPPAPAPAAPPPPPAPYGDPTYASAPPPPPTGPPPATPRTVGFLGRRVVRIVVVIVVVIAVGAVYGSLRNKHSAASAPGKGSCIWAEGTDSNNPKIHKVACSDPKAQYTVLSKITGGNDSACDSVTGTDASYTETDNNKPVYVLCLQQTK